MALILQTDTYILLADAELYLTSHYMSSDAKLIAWQTLIDADKEILLRKAAQAIDRMQFSGRKASVMQTLQFPRTYYNHRGKSLNYYEDFTFTQAVTPEAVKHAQCEIAIDLTQGTDDRAEMQRAGVKSFSLGNLSESYGSAKDITSFEARKLLAQFTLGGARID